MKHRLVMMGLSVCTLAYSSGARAETVSLKDLVVPGNPLTGKIVQTRGDYTMDGRWHVLLVHGGTGMMRLTNLNDQAVSFARKNCVQATQRGNAPCDGQVLGSQGKDGVFRITSARLAVRMTGEVMNLVVPGAPTLGDENSDHNNDDLEQVSGEARAPGNIDIQGLKPGISVADFAAWGKKQGYGLPVVEWNGSSSASNWQDAAWVKTNYECLVKQKHPVAWCTSHLPAEANYEGMVITQMVFGPDEPIGVQGVCDSLVAGRPPCLKATFKNGKAVLLESSQAVDKAKTADAPELRMKLLEHYGPANVDRRAAEGYGILFAQPGSWNKIGLGWGTPVPVGSPDRSLFKNNVYPLMATIENLDTTATLVIVLQQPREPLPAPPPPVPLKF